MITKLNENFEIVRNPPHKLLINQAQVITVWYWNKYTNFEQWSWICPQVWTRLKLWFMVKTANQFIGRPALYRVEKLNIAFLWYRERIYLRETLFLSFF